VSSDSLDLIDEPPKKQGHQVKLYIETGPPSTVQSKLHEYRDNIKHKFQVLDHLGKNLDVKPTSEDMIKRKIKMKIRAKKNTLINQ